MKHHSVLCVGTVSDQGHPLFQFKAHAIENHELFLLAGQIVASVLCGWRATGDLQGSMAPFLHFISKPWWEVSPHEPDFLKKLLEDSLGLLRQALALQLRDEERQFLDVINMDFYSRIVGLLDLNDHTIEIKAPLQVCFEHLVEKGGEYSGVRWEQMEPVVKEIVRIRQEAHEHSEDEGGDEEGMAEDKGEEGPIEINSQLNVFPMFDGKRLSPSNLQASGSSPLVP